MPSVAKRARSLASYGVWYVQTFVSEARTLPRRIHLLSQKTNPIDLGPIYEESPSGQLLPCKATIARTQYVEFLLARYPWATDADILLALDGWNKGTEYSLGTRGTDNMDAVSARDQYDLALTD